MFSARIGTKQFEKVLDYPKGVMYTSYMEAAMNYTVKLTKDSAEVIGLPDVYLHFAHHDFAIVWNSETKRQDVIRPADTFYGSNVGEGQTYKTWQDAIHASLYDYFQYGEEFHNGDTFVVEYLGTDARFMCDGVHVVRQ